MRRWALALLYTLGVGVLCGAEWPGTTWPRAGGPGDDIFSHIDCHPTFGCNDPDGILLIDTASAAGFTSGARNQNNDYGTDATDYIDPAVEFGGNRDFRAPIDALQSRLGRTLTMSTQAARELFCRCDGSFEVCDGVQLCGTGNCVTTMSNSITYDTPLVIDTEDMHGVGVTGYQMLRGQTFNACDGVGSTLTIYQGLAAATAATAEVGSYLYDNIHQTDWGANWDAQGLLLATYEDQFTPRLNLFENGYFEQGCDTGWTTSGTTATATDGSFFNTNPASVGVASSFYGLGCEFPTDNAGDFFESDLVDVDPGTWYVMKCIARTNAGAVQELTFEPLSAASTPIVGGDTYICQGNCADAGTTEGVADYVIQGSLARGWGRWMTEFKTGAGDTQAKLRISPSSATSTQFQVDECVMHKSVDQDGELQFIIPDGEHRIVVLGDSRSTNTLEFAGSVGEMLDGGMRPGVTLVPAGEANNEDRVFLRGTDAVNGRKLQHVVDRTATHAPDGTDAIAKASFFDCWDDVAIPGKCQGGDAVGCCNVSERDENGLPVIEWRGGTPTVVVVKMAVNDLTSTRAIADMFADIRSIHSDVLPTGAQFFLLMEPHIYGDVQSFCSGGINDGNTCTSVADCAGETCTVNRFGVDFDRCLQDPNMQNCGNSIPEYNGQLLRGADGCVTSCGKGY